MGAVSQWSQTSVGVRTPDQPDSEEERTSGKKEGDGSEDGEGFYLWEFADDDNEKFISIAKWEGVPFQAYLSEAVSQDSVVVYRQ